MNLETITKVLEWVVAVNSVLVVVLLVVMAVEP